MTRRRQEKRSEKVEERRIREVEWKTDMKEEQEARRAGMAFENNYTFDPVGAKNVEVGDGEQARQGPAGSDEAAAGGLEQAGGSEEKEDDLGRMLQDQAEYRSPAPDWPGTRRWASRPWSWPRATTPPGNLLPWCGAGGGVTVPVQ